MVNYTEPSRRKRMAFTNSKQVFYKGGYFVSLARLKRQDRKALGGYLRKGNILTVPFGGVELGKDEMFCYTPSCLFQIPFSLIKFALDSQGELLWVNPSHAKSLKISKP